MQADQIPPLLLRQMGLRIGPHMARYISESLAQDASKPLPVMAADARTGVATCCIIKPADLQPQSPKP